jgi:hypothetical protein
MPGWAPGFEPGRVCRIPPRARMPPLFSSQSSVMARCFVYQAAVHTGLCGVRCWLTMMHQATGDVERLFRRNRLVDKVFRCDKL